MPPSATAGVTSPKSVYRTLHVSSKLAPIVNDERRQAGAWSFRRDHEFGTKAVLVMFGLVSLIVVVSIAVCWGKVAHSACPGDSLSSWLAQIDGPQSRQAREAIRRLGRQAVPQLLEMVRTGAESCDSISYVLSLLGPAVVPDLIAGCSDPDEYVRETAVGALILLGPQSGDIVQS